MLEGETKRRRNAMVATVASIVGVTTIGWVVAGVASGHLVPLGAIVLPVLALAIGFTALVAAGSDMVPAGRPLEPRERRALVRLMLATAVIGAIALGLAAARSPATAAVAAVETLVGLWLLGYAARCLMRVPEPSQDVTVRRG